LLALCFSDEEDGARVNGSSLGRGSLLINPFLNGLPSLLCLNNDLRDMSRSLLYSELVPDGISEENCKAYIRVEEAVLDYGLADLGAL